MANIFYVYEHWRPDKDACFYVGKGHGKRAWEARRRNKYYRNVAAKLARIGLCVEVRMVRGELSEGDALALEIERILFWQSSGAKLANLTKGGEGVVGLKHSDETKSVIREKRKAQKIIHSQETRAKIGAANAISLKGRKSSEHSARMKGRKLSDAHKKKISDGMIGRSVSSETREKIRASILGQKRSEVTRLRLRESHIGNRPTKETREKMRTAQLRRWKEKAS